MEVISLLSRFLLVRTEDFFQTFVKINTQRQVPLLFPILKCFPPFRIKTDYVIQYGICSSHTAVVFNAQRLHAVRFFLT